MRSTTKSIRQKRTTIRNGLSDIFANETEIRSYYFGLIMIMRKAQYAVYQYQSLSFALFGSAAAIKR